MPAVGPMGEHALPINFAVDPSLDPIRSFPDGLVEVVDLPLFWDPCIVFV